VSLVCGVPAGSGQPFQAEVDGVQVYALPILDIGRRLGVELAVPLHAVTTLRSLVRGSPRPTILLANGLHFPSTVAALLVARITAVPLVTTCHVARVPLPSRVLQGLVHSYEASIGRLILRSSAEVVVVSSAVSNHIDGLARTARVTTVPNGVDIGRFRPEPVSPTTPGLVFVGRLIGNKGPDVLVDAVTLLRARGRPVRATFVGDGPMRAALEHLVRDRGLVGAVRFVGHVSEVERYLSSGTIFVRPSSSEGMPLAVLEAMAAGCCVIATDIPGTNDLIVNHENGLLVAPRDAYGLACAVQALCDQPALRNRLSQAARDTARRYSWDATARGVEEVLTRAARRHYTRCRN
jgi:glycosyltransferase involved in cell wall biosynthesis